MKKILGIICLGFLLILSSPEVYAFAPGGYNSFKVTTSGYSTAQKQTGGFADAPTSITNAYNNQKVLFINTLNDYMNNGGCWFCSVFSSLLTAINRLATVIFQKLNNIFLILLGFGLLFVILFKVGKMLVQLQEVNLMQFIQDLFKPLGRGIIATALLTTFSTQTLWGSGVADDNIFSLLIAPFLELSLSLSSTIITVIIS